MGSTIASPYFPRSVKTANFTAGIMPLHYEIGLGSAEVTATLPAVASTQGLPLRFTLETGGNRRRAILDANGAETINGNTTLELLIPGDMVELTPDGTDWLITTDNRQMCTTTLSRSLSVQTITTSLATLIEHDTEVDDSGNVGFIHASHAITVANTSTEKFTIAGDQTATFGNGIIGFEVTGSTGNDGFYTATAVESGGATVFTVDQDITDATADGNIIFNGFVARRAAKVSIQISGAFAGIDDGEISQTAIFHKTVFFKSGRQYSPAADQLVYSNLAQSLVVAAGDIVQLYGFHNEGANNDTLTAIDRRMEITVSEVILL